MWIALCTEGYSQYQEREFVQSIVPPLHTPQTKYPLENDKVVNTKPRPGINFW